MQLILVRDRIAARARGEAPLRRGATHAGMTLAVGNVDLVALGPRDEVDDVRQPGVEQDLQGSIAVGDGPVGVVDGQGAVGAGHACTLVGPEQAPTRRGGRWG